MAASSASRFLDLLKILTDHKVDFIIVGGVAGVLAGAPLLTLDLDVVFDSASANVDRLLQVLSKLNAIYRDPAGRQIEPDAGKLETLRMNLFTTDLGDLDVMRSVGHGLEYADLQDRCRAYEVSDLRVRAIDLPTLIETKEFANRPKDQYALLFLREVLALQEQAGPNEGDSDA